ncbi:MAG: response regulator, partial [Bacteroidetes bacterium]|nr:response regulator [Bacteroidota bacterium]
MELNKLLWVDDEIELLKSHIIFLSEKGYEVDTATNGEDAISSVKEKKYDLILLDEMMAGMGGLETLSQIKTINPNIPVVMITKSEEESLMDEAIGGKITDYLTKPVNPSQVLLVCKKILEGKRITGEYAAKDYLQDFNQISQALMGKLDYAEWIDIYRRLVNWDLELDQHAEIGLKQTLFDQRKEANKEFSKFFENGIHINSKEYKPLNYYIQKIRYYFEKLIKDSLDSLNIIHGDFCLANILYDPK